MKYFIVYLNGNQIIHEDGSRPDEIKILTELEKKIRRLINRAHNDPKSVKSGVRLEYKDRFGDDIVVFLTAHDLRNLTYSGAF